MANAIPLSARRWRKIRKDDGTETAPQVELCNYFDMFSGFRPIRAIPGVHVPLADPQAKGIDLVILRESKEEFFKGREKGEITGDEGARKTQIITRLTSERLFRFDFGIARSHKVHGGPPLNRRDGARLRAPALGFRRPADGKIARR